MERMTEDELQQLLEKTLPAADLHEVFVEECQDQDIRLRFSLKPGETWSSAALLSLVDTSLRAAAGVASSLTHLNVTLLKPAHAADVIALSRVIRRDGDVVHAEAWLFSHAVVDPMLHATASLRTPSPG
jgi:acyl-coenzyme A thioesterase PaaI-like protein